MIDWGNLAANALWILGCALALATFSYASWEASRSGEKLRSRLGRAGIQISFDIAGVLFCSGLAITSDSILETVLWAVLAVLFAAQIFLAARRGKVSQN